MAKTVAKSFQAALEHDNTPLRWVIVRIPFDVAKAWGTRGMLKVRGDINGFAFRTSLFPAGNGAHTLLVNKRMQAGAKATVGTVARFRLEPDTEERAVTLPAELQQALSEDRALPRWFAKLNYSMRKYLADRVSEVKGADARVRRAGQIAEQVLSAMEAERDLPPILRMAFAHDPQAHEGWKLMSPSRRRGHLLGIFYYRNPGSRARRAAKAVKEAYELAERKKGRKAPGRSRE